MRPDLITRRHALAGATTSTFLFAARGLALSAAKAEAPPPLFKRKSVDALTPDELENYKHAVNILKQRNVPDHSREDSYDYQARLHNVPRRHPDGARGACEHGSEQFFPWHRPHLAGFEKLLRESDPPKTANVTLPYWDWTKPPSGGLFPIAFEDQESPLFNSGRRTSGSPPTWAGNDILDMVREPDWDLFAGRPKGPDQSYGVFESGPHNTMHGDIGQTMGNPSTASNDPIYWSFHAYVDLVWARWQRIHQQTFGCGDCIVWLEPNSYKVNEKVTTKDWGYEYDYDFSPDGAPIAVAAKSGPTTPLPMTEMTERSAAAKLAVPKSETRKILKIEKVRPLPDATYRIYIYLHPADVRVADLSDEQRRQYLVRSVTIWQSTGHHPEASDVLVDLTRALAKAGANQVVSIITENAPTGEAAPRMAPPLPKIQGLLQGMSIEER